MGLAEDLKIIKDAELDIELLHRDNDKKCLQNNDEIEKLKEKIKSTEYILEEELKASGEKKLECKIGYCSFRTMPDKWIYDKGKFLYWLKGYGKNYDKYVKVEEILKKQAIKEDILEKPLLHIAGVTHEAQEPKFNYKIK